MLTWGPGQLSAGPWQILDLAEKLWCDFPPGGWGVCWQCPLGSAWPGPWQLLHIPAQWPQTGSVSLQLMGFVLLHDRSLSWWISLILTLVFCPIWTDIFCSEREIWRMVFCFHILDSSGATLNALLEVLNFVSNLSPLSCEYLGYTSTYFCPRFSALCLFPFLGCSFSLIWKPPLCLCCFFNPTRIHSLICYWDVSEKSFFLQNYLWSNWLWTITVFSQETRTYPWISVHLFLPLSVTFFVVMSPKTQISFSKLPSLIVFRYKLSILKLTSHY